MAAKGMFVLVKSDKSNNNSMDKEVISDNDTSDTISISGRVYRENPHIISTDEDG